jgi:hypothetical protein
MSFGKWFSSMNRSLPEAEGSCVKTVETLGFRPTFPGPEQAVVVSVTTKRNVSLDSFFPASVHLKANFKESHLMPQGFPSESYCVMREHLARLRNVSFF